MTGTTRKATPHRMASSPYLPWRRFPPALAAFFCPVAVPGAIVIYALLMRYWRKQDDEK